MSVKGLFGKYKKFTGYGLYLNEMLDASLRHAPAGSRSSASKIAPGDFVRKMLEASLERSCLTHSYGYEPANDRPTLFSRGVPKQRIPAPRPSGAALERVQNRSRRFCAGFSPSFVPFMQYTG